MGVSMGLLKEQVGFKSRKGLLWVGLFAQQMIEAASLKCSNFNHLNADEIFGRDRYESRHNIAEDRLLNCSGPDLASDIRK
jgi:hypothetical protein